MPKACACCGAVEIAGPYCGEMVGTTMHIRLFQCWGDHDGQRCENTRALEVKEVNPEDMREKA